MNESFDSKYMIIYLYYTYMSYCCRRPQISRFGRIQKLKIGENSLEKSLSVREIARKLEIGKFILSGVANELFLDLKVQIRRRPPNKLSVCQIYLFYGCEKISYAVQKLQCAC